MRLLESGGFISELIDEHFKIKSNLLLQSGFHKKALGPLIGNEAVIGSCDVEFLAKLTNLKTKHWFSSVLLKQEKRNIFALEGFDPSTFGL
jgi:hypothetical protein